MSGDNRTVHTDALDSLGRVLSPIEGNRDAIHLAVIPMIAGETLYPGQDIGITGNTAYASSPHLGIVDPFIKGKIMQGDKFWMVIYPRTITSLRHVWEHPAFPEVDIEKLVKDTVDSVLAIPAPVIPTKSVKELSEDWMMEFCRTNDAPDYWHLREMLEDAESYIEGFGSDMYFHSEGDDAHCSIPAEFWFHAEMITGKQFPVKATYFSCSC